VHLSIALTTAPPYPSTNVKLEQTMREIGDEELESEDTASWIEDDFVVQQITITEMLFVLATAAIIAFVAVIYYP
jgi:hypothetical protein